MNVCASQAVTLSTPFADDLNAHADAGAVGVEIWLTKLETYLETAGLDDVKGIEQSRRLNLVAAAFQGGLLLSQGEARSAHFEHFKRRLGLCQELGIPTMILTADFRQPPDATSAERALVSAKQAAQWAAAFDVKLALEFRGSDAYCSCLDTTLNFIDAVAEPNLGVCLDWFHFYKGPSKPEDLDRLSPANLFHVQVSDVPGVPRELMTDADRVFPGEGDFRFGLLTECLERIHYSGWVSVELMNPVLWRMKPSQVVELALTSVRKLFA